MFETMSDPEATIPNGELVPSTENEKHLAWEWLRTRALSENDDAKYAAIMLSELERLRDLAYVPGEFSCVKCKLVMHALVFSVRSGAISGDNKPQQCPNGCGYMQRVAERDERRASQKDFLELAERARKRTQ